MKKKLGDYENKVIIQSKVMDFSFFVMVGFSFPEHLTFSTLAIFFSWRGDYYNDLVKIFYTNLTPHRRSSH